MLLYFLHAAARTSVSMSHPGDAYGWLPRRSSWAWAIKKVRRLARETSDRVSALIRCVWLRRAGTHNPIVTVISSGDDEPHSHPRAETLGAIGVNSRGERPLIFSTELARSAKDAIRDPANERRQLKAAHLSVLKAATAVSTARSAGEKVEARKRKNAANKSFRRLVDDTINRTVQVYGAIYVRTDGKDVVIGQRIERGWAGRQWDVSSLHPGATGELQFVSKYHGE